MDRLSKSLEVLKLLSSTTSETLLANNERYIYIQSFFFLHFISHLSSRSRLDPISISKDKIHHLNTITDLLCSPALIK